MAVIPNANRVGLSVDFNLELVHGFVSLIVVCSVDKDFVEDLVETWHVRDFAMVHPDHFVIDPHLVFSHLDGSHVGIRSKEYVLEGRLLLIDLLNGLTVVRLGLHDLVVIVLRF